ncbi:MAG: hypothetical protein LBC88_03260 [Spirochaetaceae bacterium]|jgi:hypothetical protein|nr:hypothetical protein [Spirochaetaceae bacterium]
MTTRKERRRHKETEALDRPRRILDAVVILLCLAGAGVSLNLFRIDLFQTIRSFSAVPVGTITFKYNTAQRRLSDRVLWDRLRNESPVYEGDLIRTAELSGAVLHFAGGGEIALDENTLIRIQMNDDQAAIDLAEGNVNVSAGESGIVLNAGGRRIEAAAGTVMTAGNRTDGLVFQVSEGNAIFVDEAGSREVEAGSFVVLDASGEELKEPAALIFSPRPNARILNPYREPLEMAFSWNRVNIPPEEKITLELAEDRNFARVSQTLETPGNSVMAKLPPGTWNWRLVYNMASLAHGRITVVYAPAPALIAPAPDYTYRYRSRTPSVHFFWAGTGDALYYILEAAPSPDFSTPGFSSQVRGTSLVTSNLGPGTWYWRVRPVFPGDFGGVIAASAAASFRVEQSGMLEAPALISPAEGGFVNIAGDRGDYYFSWRQANEAASYTIRIAKSADLRNPVINATVRDNFWIYRRGERDIAEGDYYWGVFQTDAEGNESSVSPPRVFTAMTGQLVQRMVFPPDGYTIAENLLPDIRFTWKSNIPYETFFQVSDEAGFSRFQINERVSGDTFQGRTLPAGTWYWRISARPPPGSLAGGALETPPRRFIAAPSFPAPALERPAAGERIILREDEPVQFRWRTVNGAEYYQFRVYTDRGRSRLVHEVAITETTAQPVNMDNLPEGEYYWTVQSFALEGTAATRRIGLTGEGRFVTRKLRPLNLDSPRQGAEIAGLTALRGATILRWNSMENPGRSRFIISRSPDPTLGTPLQEIANPDRSISLSRLAPGVYYWTVTAETIDGYDISAEAPRSFRVLPIPLLPEVPAARPVNGHTIGPEELRANRNIVFRWGTVAGANGYIFTLFQDRGRDRRQVIRTGPVNETSFTVDNLEILDRGTFVWQVEAVGAGSDGSIEQHGRLAENRLEIDIPVPNQVRTENPGVLYGQ